MVCNPIKIRKYNRLREYDYSQNGYYFITVCTWGRIEWFGIIENGIMKLNEHGEIARNILLEIPLHFENIKLDEFKIMPNHIHVIIIVGDRHACPLQVKPQYQTIPVIVGSYKSAVSREIHRMKNGIDFRWQKSFYDHVIRDEISLNKIREYIRDNPLLWDKDIENKDNYSGGVDYYEKLF